MSRLTIKRRMKQPLNLFSGRAARMRWLCLCSFSLLTLTATSVNAQTTAYQDWIQQARQGSYTSALDGLQQYQRENSDDLRVQLDLIRVHHWAGHPTEVLFLYQNLPSNLLLPADVLLIVARTHKDNQQWKPALRLYREGTQRFPGQQAFIMGLCMTLADDGQTTNALDCAQALKKSTPQNHNYLLTRSYIYRVSSQPYEALRASQDALALQPNETEVIRNHELALHTAGLHRQAFEWQGQHNSLFSINEQRSRQADYAAELTRLAPQPTRTLAERFVLANRAVQLQDQLVSSATGLENPIFLQRVHGDRLIAIDVREDITPAVDISPERTTQYPDYAYGALGELQLRARQPEQAMASYERALTEPSLDAKTRLRYQTGLSFALLEAGHENQALALSEEMERNTPTSYVLLGNPEELPNPDHTDALILKNTLYMYAGLLKPARENLAQASALAPSNVNLRVPLADAQRMSHLPRHAEHNLKIAENSAPLQEDVIISQAQTALELQEYRQTEVLLNYAKKHYPTNTRVLELEKDWQTHRKNELILRSGFESGTGADVSGQDGLINEAQWYSAPLAYNWHATVLAGHLKTNDDLGHNVSWQGAGAEWRTRDWNSLMLVKRQDWGHGFKVGASVQVDHDLNDYWRIGTTLDYRTLDIPNRALAQNITANLAQLRVRTQSGPEQWVQAAYTATRFSDSNHRHSFQLTANQRLYTTPRFRVDAQLELWTSANKDINAPYFNPRREYMAVPTLRLEQLLYQRYEKRLSHALNIGAGIYHQRGYGNGGVGKVGYEITYQHDRNLEVGINLQALTRPYDGKRERQTSGALELKIKF